jgi:hypothetical protein
MRSRYLALFLCAGTTAFCEPAAPVAVSPDEWGRLETAFTHPAWEMNKLPSDWQMTNTAQTEVLIWHEAGAARAWNDARVDPRMILHPPPSSVGTQPPSTLVAKNQYPGLRFQPVQWPHLKLQRIPTEWFRLKIGPVGSDELAAVRAAVK